MGVALLHGDCRAVMAGMDAESVDAIVTDPPYGLEFMGKAWDRLGDIGKVSHAGPTERDGSTVFGRQRVAFNGSSNIRCRTCGKWKWGHVDGDSGGGGKRCSCETPDFPSARPDQARLMQDWHESWAREAYRVLKPGGHLFAFGGTRTVHRLTCAIEDAGFEIRDKCLWLYGSGFPKSHDVSKAMDKAAGVEREVGVVSANARPKSDRGNGLAHGEYGQEWNDTAPATDLARAWEGWGTALKPAHEDIVLARKPLIGTVAANVERHGTGSLHIDGCRIEADWSSDPTRRGWQGGNSQTVGVTGNLGCVGDRVAQPNTRGRWPANAILDEEAAAMLDEAAGERKSGGSSHERSTARHVAFGEYTSGRNGSRDADTGGPSRFFYCAKSSRSERNAGLEGMPERDSTHIRDKAVRECVVCGSRHKSPLRWPACEHDNWAWVAPNDNGHKGGRVINHHPTVKPVALMRWLCRLITPPDGLILDPFMGSGTTGIAAVLEGFAFVGIEQDESYITIAEARIAHWTREAEKAESLGPLFELAAD